MNITYLLGNGFDLNIGLRTKYTDFIPEYVNLETKDEVLKTFRKDLNREIDLWSDAEMAFGQYTKYFAYRKSDVEEFLKCHEDFCVQLGKYLEQEESTIDYSNLEDRLVAGFVKSIKTVTRGFRTEQRDAIQKNIDNVGGGFQYDFISFNYTRVVDKCVEYARKKQGILGNRTYKHSQIMNKIGQMLHVHGYTNKDMVLGVNDESQIANMKLFENQHPEYLAQLVKRKTNQMNEEYIDNKARTLLENSDLIYIYGMSIGETDAIWWKRICELLSKNENLKVIINCFDAPQEGLFRTRHIGYEREMRQKFVSFSELDEQKKDRIMKQIHIATTNLFDEIKDICIEKKVEQTLEAM